MTQLRTSLYDPAKTYKENFVEGPFGLSTENAFVNEGEPQFEVFGQKVYSP